MVNLVGNAIKFTERGEVVVARRGRVADRRTRSCLHFAVTDTGIGIPADKQRPIFEPFAQADGSTTRRYGGTGLGLAISSQLVELMGGRIWVESEVGRGQHVPLHRAVRACRRTPSAAGGRRADRRCDGLPVLVVDDNATNRRILEEMLTNWRMKPDGRRGRPQPRWRR